MWRVLLLASSVGVSSAHNIAWKSRSEAAVAVQVDSVGSATGTATVMRREQQDNPKVFVDFGKVLHEQLVQQSQQIELEQRASPSLSATLVPAASTSLALAESLGFIVEADDQWQLRKTVHAAQIKMQRDSIANGKNCDGPAATFYQCFYEPSFHCEFEERLGGFGDGGKWICDPVRIAQQDKCLVFSIGSNGDYGFEQAVHDRISEKCEIHTVDRQDWKAYTQTAPPSFVNYLIATVGTGPGEKDVHTLLTELSALDRVIDIFKIDCEGCEWDTYESWLRDGVFIRQIQVELHGVNEKTHKFFEFLLSRGYVVFNKEPNTLGCGGNCIEFAFLKLSPEF